ncbi:MAG: GxxExxY protein [Candidatus Hydrogenedentes bacterium]|nr:GxxExxY protein [Candidatus Hydrogenedentota bacterium]
MKKAADGAHAELTEKIIGCCFTVANELGVGFIEKVYENAVVHELRKGSLNVVQQNPLAVHYDGVVVGEFFLDVVVEGSVIVELKAVSELNNFHEAQCLNYLKASGLHTCLLINFGQSRLKVRRFSL